MRYQVLGLAMSAALWAGVPLVGGVGTVQAQTVQDRKNEAARLVLQGARLYETSQFEAALRAWEQALKIYLSIKDRSGEGTAIGNLGVAYYALGKYDKAIEFHLQSLALAKETQSRLSEGAALGNLGIAYNALGEYDKAIELQLQRLAISKEVKDRTSEAQSLGNLGVAYYALGKYDKAIEFHLQSLVLANDIKDRAGEGRALGNLGSTYYALGKYDKAIEFHLQSLALANDIKDRSGEGNTISNLGIAYSALGEYDKAIEFHSDSLLIAREIKDRQGEEQSLGNLGNAYYALGKYDKAIEFQLQSLVLAREIKNRRGEANALGDMGRAYSALNKYDKAIEFQLQSLAIAREIKDRRGEANALGNLGSTYEALNKYDKAIEFQLQSLAITREIKDRRGEGSALGNLGVAYSALGKYDKALEFYLQSLAILRKIKDRNGEGRALGNLGVAYSALGKYDKALESCLQFLAIAREIKDRNGEGRALGNIGNAYFSLNKYDKAIEFYLQFLAIAREIKDRSGEMLGLNNLAAVYGKLNRGKEAMTSLQKALTISKAIGDRNGEGLSLANLANILHKDKRPELAILFYKQSINVRESIRKDIKKLDKDLQQSYLATVENTYRDLAYALLQQNRIIEALQVLDLLKIQELEDYLKNIKGSDRSAQGVRLLAPELALSDKLLAVNFDNASELNRQLANQIQQLPQSEINKVPDYLNQIPKGTVLLYPFILGDRLEIILFSPNNLPIRRTVNISQNQIKALVTEFKIDLVNTRSEDYKESGQELYDLLIKPIENDLKQFNAKTILYAPDGQLRYIPLAALYDGKQFLVEKYQISNLIAYTLTDFSHRTQNIQPNILAGAFGGQSGEKKFGEDGLPATITEVDRITNYFQNQAIALKEDQFSRQATESRFKNHNILHFATHATFNSGRPDQSFILFGNGDKILLNEIADWQIPNVDLIILSACQTGLGDLGTGVEILGFGYQVQKAGAKQAIASLWSVVDDKTGVLMSAFYGELQKGNISVTEALRRSQVSLIQSKDYSHPFYWSAFFAIGNGL